MSYISFVYQVYIFGGLLGNLALSSAECYTPTTNQWTLITPMSVARGAMGAIAYNDQIFVVSVAQSRFLVYQIDSLKKILNILIQ